MALYKQLQQAQSEEDVKDAYIKALGLKKLTKGLIDIQTDAIWFEAKDTGKHSSYAMFTQLLHYVQVALNQGERVAPFLCVIDTVKAAIMKTADVLPFLEKKTIKWGKSASQYTPEALAEVSSFIGTYFVSFRIDTHEAEFIETVKAAIQSGDIIRTQITPDNLKQVFDKWVAMVGREMKGVSEADYVLLFFADIMHDGTHATHDYLTAKLLHDGAKPVFFLNGQMLTLGSYEGYRQFWMIYHKPPKAEYRNYLLERRDSLIPTDERSFKGAYYTPLAVVDKAYDYLNSTLGVNWQREYIVWDMCCGVGNLEVKHANHRNLFMSTLDKADIDVMNAAKTCVAAERFQYDYLNDDITADGQIDYSLTNKLPKALQQAIHDHKTGKAGAKKILVLINPPYAEATNADTVTGGDNKAGVAKTKWAEVGMAAYGKARNELFTQFVARIAKEIPNANLAMFSTLKYVNAPNFADFRAVWNADFKAGFVIHSKSFEGLKGNFPIGFLIWQTDHRAKAKPKIIESISVEVLDKNVKPEGEKAFYNLPNESFLNVWIKRPKANKQTVVPLKNSITPTEGKVRVSNWADSALSYMYCGVNDIQHAGQQTVIFSSPYGGGNGFYITAANLWQAAIVFSVRQLIPHTWVNHNDQFLQPTGELTAEFKLDCLMWMLFHGKNLTASANELEWNHQTWSIVNHFIPFSEAEVGAPGRFESDFMVQYLAEQTAHAPLSPEAVAVLDEGRRLWQAYFAISDTHSTRDALKLNRPDVGWYQIRKALEARNAEAHGLPTSFTAFKTAYETLGDKLRPMVFELGFMKA